MKFSWIQVHYIKISHYYPKWCEPFGGDINIKVNLSNYATKTDLINAKWTNTSILAEKSYFVRVTAKVEKWDINNLKKFTN